MGRKIRDVEFIESFKIFTESQGTQFQKLQRFQAAIALWYKEEMTWSHDDLIAAVKTLEQPMTQRFIDANISASDNFIKDDKTNKWVMRDDCDPSAVIKQLMSTGPILPNNIQNMGPTHDVNTGRIPGFQQRSNTGIRTRLWHRIQHTIPTRYPSTP